MPQRAQIEQQGYTIIANLGDQPSDLAGGYAERTYQLPNPFCRIPLSRDRSTLGRSGFRGQVVVAELTLGRVRECDTAIDV